MRIRSITIGLIAAAGLGLGCGLGAGDNVFSGIGNSGNHVYSDSLRELATELARSEVVAEISDAELARIFATISRRAEEGDLESALVVFRVAAEQRGD